LYWDIHDPAVLYAGLFCSNSVGYARRLKHC